ncbi:MAG TPA: hypothetical protein VGN46_20090 [Luteibacter sp.]|jgi:hypothetical protein|uniref:hypothetical protein n=1 Tax=Luteibacter sp. TaxID=1886636 RepID=UPI002F41CCDD
MRVPNETQESRDAGSNIEHEPSAHELLNEAIVWLQYARGVTATLADLVHEADTVDCKQLGLSLEAIAAMTQAGVQRVGQAHAQWIWNARGDT